ncbi:hypothetical protein HDU87_003399 [Geranomyces variabilis]|uniref:Uncharacterized protein n=1 Tax=Geranomyces variabilis TaxID=109894 RepID=A0AAD5TJR5_9FUNG|nr:hypothetical protein HDU87_003399 [Geranomyces variabilis]
MVSKPSKVEAGFDIRPPELPGHARGQAKSVTPSVVAHAPPRLAPRSQVLQYQVKLKELAELYPKSPNAARTSGCFAILRDIIRHLGSLGGVVAQITDELYDAVYSSDYTSSEHPPFVERLPYFSAVGRVVIARSEEGAKTSDTVSDLLQKIKFREYDAQMLQRKNLALKQEISNGEANAQKLLDKIAALNGEIASQENEKVDLRATHAGKEESLKRQIDQLQSSLLQSNQVIEKLTVFKSAYDEPTNDNGYEEETDKSKQQLVIDSTGMVEYDLYQAQRLDEQFADILNWQLDDYEAALSQLHQKQEILSGVKTGTEERDESYRLELGEIINGFRKRIADLLEEQQLLKKHVQGLKIVLSNFAGDRLMNVVQRTADEALRKYAFAMHLSEDKGLTFAPFKAMRFCTKCGDRTVVCPHRTLLSETVELPALATHIRFSHPSLRLRTNFNRAVFEADLPVRLAMLDYEPGVTEDENEEATPTFRKLWKEYYEKRDGTKPQATRVMTASKVLGIILDIYDRRWAYECEIDRDTEHERELSRFEDFFYEQMIERYQIKDIARKAIHDFYTSLQLLEETNSAVWIFVRHLSGDEDTMWKYLYLARKLFSNYEVLDAAAFRKIIQIMYPSRPKEIYDQMELELVAFSKNRFSRETVEEHLLHMLRTNIEPNQKFFRYVFKRGDHQEQSTLSYYEFEEMLSQLLPGASARVKRLRYSLSELDQGKDSVSLDRLAIIGSYISLQGCYANNWVPQALMTTDLINEAYYFAPHGAGRSSAPGTSEERARELSTVSEDAGTRAEIQGDIDRMLNADTFHNTAVDSLAVEEEAQRMARRIELMNRMESNDAEEDSDSDDYTSLHSRNQFPRH